MLALQNLFGKGKRWRYLAEDETRVGLKSDTGQVITALGVKPVATVQWARENFWVYGVVEPLSGWHLAQQYNHLNSKHFQSFLDPLSQQLGEDIALLQLDQAGAHQALAKRRPENIIPVLQPAHSPQLNPTERLWQQIKVQLQGEHFSTLEQLSTRIKQLFEELTYVQIASFTSYDFILEALFYAAL